MIAYPAIHPEFLELAARDNPAFDPMVYRVQLRTARSVYTRLRREPDEDIARATERLRVAGRAEAGYRARHKAAAAEDSRSMSRQQREDHAARLVELDQGVKSASAEKASARAELESSEYFRERVAFAEAGMRISSPLWWPTPRDAEGKPLFPDLPKLRTGEEWAHPDDVDRADGDEEVLLTLHLIRCGYPPPKNSDYSLTEENLNV